MYCPRCGNHPASDRVRFCPSCGFRLDGVVDLLARDGVPTNIQNVPPANIPQSGELSERRIGIRRGGKLVFFSMGIFLPVLAFCFVVEHPAPMFLPASIFLAGIFSMIYYRLFGDEHAQPPMQTQPAYFGPPPQQAYFPQQPAAPPYRTPVDTPQEQSVAEHTTRSLGRQ
jgi:zinc-ribbon domain